MSITKAAFYGRLFAVTTELFKLYSMLNLILIVML
jgi:hypothetical protein